MDFLKTLEQIRTPFGDAFFLTVTQMGGEILLLGLIMVMYWCVDKKFAYRLTFAYMTAALAVNAVKLICRVPRPWVRDPSLKPVEKAVESATGYSFPSGHTQNAVSLYGTLSWKTKKPVLKVLYLLMIPAVMFSRLYLGVHTPEDVAVSLIISAVIVIVINILADRIVFTKKKRLVTAVCVIALTAATFIWALIMYGRGIVAYADIADICKGCGAGAAFGSCWYIESEYIGFEEKTDSLFRQIFKFLIGFAGAMAIRIGIKAVFGSNIAADMTRYFLMMCWAMLAMPLIIKKYFQRKR